MRIRIDVMYDGTGFCGWQVQPRQRSVQGEIADAVKRLTGETIEVAASGRTDAGVHALGQVAHFDIIKPFDIAKIPAGLNFYLDPRVRVVNAREVPPAFHARFSAKSKTYIYKMYIARCDNPLLANRALRLDPAVYSAPQIAVMRQTAGLFAGRHDFASFMSSGSDVKTTVRTVLRSSLLVKGRELVYRITADGFLYNMVRKIMGTILAAGAGKISLADIGRLLESGEPPVKEIVPPHGLYLYHVKY